MEISKMLTISTAHITNDVSDTLNCQERPYGNVIEFPKDDYGWFVYCYSDIDDLKQNAGNIPKCLYDAMEFAQNNGCIWLCIDCDGEKVDLPTYDED